MTASENDLSDQMPADHGLNGRAPPMPWSARWAVVPAYGTGIAPPARQILVGLLLRGEQHGYGPPSCPPLRLQSNLGPLRKGRSYEPELIPCQRCSGFTGCYRGRTDEWRR